MLHFSANASPPRILSLLLVRENTSMCMLAGFCKNSRLYPFAGVLWCHLCSRWAMEGNRLQHHSAHCLQRGGGRVAVGSWPPGVMPLRVCLGGSPSCQGEHPAANADESQPWPCCCCRLASCGRQAGDFRCCRLLLPSSIIARLTWLLLLSSCVFCRDASLQNCYHCRTNCVAHCD